MTQYEPGTVAVATVRGEPNVRVMRGSGAWLVCLGTHNVREYDYAEHVTDVRPLLVLDPDELHLRDLPVFLRACRGWRHDLDAVADQIEAQTRPPKPPEPTGLGAVVQDRRGVRWVRTADPLMDWVWRSNPRADVVNAQPYDAIDAVEVLSEGIA